MAKTKATMRTFTKYNKVWIKNWSHLHKSTNIPLADYMKRTLKYYPKTRQCLKPISLQIDNTQSLNLDELEIKGLYRKITQRYKAVFYRHLKISSDLSYLNNRKFSLNLNSVQSMSIEAPSEIPFSPVFLMFVKKLMAQNKQIKTMKLSGKEMPSSILRWVKYGKTLRSLELTDLTQPESGDYKCLLAGKSKLRTLAITENVENYDAPVEVRNSLAEILDRILPLPSIKQFQFDGKVSDEFDVSTIPFSALQKKGVRSDIRVFQGANTMTFTEENMQSLKDLNMLGLNFKKRWESKFMEWGIYQEESLKAQAASQNRLFLNLFSIPEIDLSNLFASCQNITTLDLLIPGLQAETMNNAHFSGLQSLCNLRNLFIRIDNMSRFHESLLKNLTICANSYKSIQALHLYLTHTIKLDDYAETISDFLDACADTVSKLTLQISPYSTDWLTLECFYRSLVRFTQLKTLNLYWNKLYIFQRSHSNAFVGHMSQVEKILDCHCSLEEFRLLAPIGESKDLNIDFQKCKNLKKICLYFEASNRAIENCLEVESMRYLDLLIRKKLSLEEWEVILKKICKLKRLEVVKMKVSLQAEETDLRQDLSKVILKNVNLKVIALEDEANLGNNILVFTRGCNLEGLNDFFRDDAYDWSFDKCYEVHKF